jgi:hypothetical protein
MSSTTIGASKRSPRVCLNQRADRERLTAVALALNWKVWASILAFWALWWLTVWIGVDYAVPLSIAAVVLIGFAAIRTRRATRGDDTNIDPFPASEPLDEDQFAKARYLEAVERVLNRQASDQDWALINEHHERTPVA